MLTAFDSFKQINPTWAGGLGEAHVPQWGVQGGEIPLDQLKHHHRYPATRNHELIPPHPTPKNLSHHHQKRRQTPRHSSQNYCSHRKMALCIIRSSPGYWGTIYQLSQTQKLAKRRSHQD